jgi:hypothetical protein
VRLFQNFGFRNRLPGFSGQAFCSGFFRPGLYKTTISDACFFKNRPFLKNFLSNKTFKNTKNRLFFTFFEIRRKTGQFHGKKGHKNLPKKGKKTGFSVF